MGLPQVELPRETIPLPDGGSAEVRGLSRGEAIAIKPLMEAVAEDGANGANANPSGPAIRALEVALIARGCDATEAEAESWYDAATGDVVGALVDAIMRLSALREGDARPMNGA